MADQSAIELLRNACPTVSIGIVSANLLALGSELALLERAGAALVHIDVMDGCYCPLMTVGPPFIKAMNTPLLKDSHLMISEPLEKVAEYAAAGSDIITFHPDASAQAHRVLQQLRALTNVNDAARGIVRGVALNPSLPLEVLDPLLDELEMILLLAVNPGWGGQKFIPATFKRIEKTQKLIAASGHDIVLGVDGGVTRTNISDIASTGVDVTVAGSAVFDGKAPEENAKFMLDAVKMARRGQPGAMIGVPGA